MSIRGAWWIPTIRSVPGPRPLKPCAVWGRDDDDVARMRLDEPVAVPKPAAALEDDERLRVRVGVSVRALTGRRVDDEARHR